MAGWKKICCAVDFSEPSRRAMQEAAELARLMRAELTLLHVYVSPPPAATDMLVAARDLGPMIAEEVAGTLAAWRADAERLVGAPVSTHVASGQPEDEISRFAAAHATDLLVVATHGRSGLRRLVLGSVAEAVARRAPCPVLVVRSGAEAVHQDLVAEAAQVH
ncbi:UspA domain protein [Anaeromyxobacter sp. K]|uniref:universal stress protein n=1 Tax=Anaeromyxobacter sp. (strain K) TaxID=447217 RepID=UPI00015F9F78|nr:universal stress protein [Anaeromyxobacter sp. K]ACG73642.1 UspA domain protein [Anaeromyxobacter sp. K]